MSKRKDVTPFTVIADWQVHVASPDGSVAGQQSITQARCERDKRGWYTFTDDHGMVAEYPPGTVHHVMRAAAGVKEDK